MNSCIIFQTHQQFGVRGGYRHQDVLSEAQGRHLGPLLPRHLQVPGEALHRHDLLGGLPLLGSLPHSGNYRTCLKSAVDFEQKIYFCLSRSSYSCACARKFT